MNCNNFVLCYVLSGISATRHDDNNDAKSPSAPKPTGCGEWFIGQRINNDAVGHKSEENGQIERVVYVVRCRYWKLNSK